MGAQSGKKQLPSQRLQESGLCTDDAALLLQTLHEVIALMSKHILLKQLEAKEGTEYRVDWRGETPVVREIRQRPAERPLQEILHIQAAAKHRRLMQQVAQEPGSSSTAAAAATQGQAACKAGMSHSMLGDPAQRELGWRVMLHSGSARQSAGLYARDKVRLHGLSVRPCILSHSAPAMQPCACLSGFRPCLPRHI